MIRRALLATFAAGLCVGGLPADAGPRTPFSRDAATEAVDTHDLNLWTEAGGQLALLRIRKAADRVCGGESSLRDAAARTRYRSCVGAAVNRAAVALVAARGESAPTILVLAEAEP